MSLQVFITPAIPVTSKALDSTFSEAVAVSSLGTAFGKVNGSTISFSNLSVPAIATTGAFYTVTVSNVRVNATSLTVSTGPPPSVTESAFVTGTTGSITPVATGAVAVAYAQNGLAPAKLFKSFTAATALPSVTVGTSSGANTFLICNSYSPKNDGYTGAAAASGKSLAFVVQVNENFTSAFKNSVDEGPQVAIAAGATSSSSVTNGGQSGTRIQVAFANVPATFALYVPVGVITSTAGGAKLQQTASPTSAFATVSASGASAVNGAPLAAVSLTGGAGSAYFEVNPDDLLNLDTFNIPVFVVATANPSGTLATAAPITVAVSFAPIGSSNIPNFTITSSTNTLNGSTLTACTTSLLFPFVTNQVGFDTGIAIANTSSDPFGSSGATNQTGSCTMYFYGSGAPSPNSVPTSTPVATGTVYTTVLSGVAAGFQGYMIAQCNFQFAHGFAFITDGVGVNGGLSEGYLAGVIPDVSQVARGANPVGCTSSGPAACPSGTGETLGN
jgi:hypothetical protein